MVTTQHRITLLISVSVVAKKGFALCGPSFITLHCPLKYIGSTCTRIVQNRGKMRYRNFKQLFESIIRKNQLAVHKIHTNSYVSYYSHTFKLFGYRCGNKMKPLVYSGNNTSIKICVTMFHHVCCTSLYQWDILYHNYFAFTQIELHANSRQIITFISLYLTNFVYNALWILLHIMFILV